jgi:hypothetical protein
LDINNTQKVRNRKFNNEWFGRNQWLTASVAKQSLAFYLVERVCGPSLGLFSKLKRINIHTQHNRPEKAEYVVHAVNPE